MWQQFVFLFPTFLVHLLISVGVSLVAFYILKNWFNYSQKPTGFVFLGALFSIYTSVNTMVGIQQSTALIEGQKRANLEAQMSNKSIPELKEEFLKTVEFIADNPKQVTPDSKKQLFDIYKNLFPQGTKDKKIYAESILQVYECQKEFYIDAQQTFQTKKLAKSQKREACENSSGVFYNREKLVTPDLVKQNEEALNKILAQQSGKKISKNGKDEGLVTLEGIQSAIQKQDNRMEVIKTLFN